METTGRTLVCSVLFLDIVEYSKKPVAEQIQLKQAFNRTLGEALEGVAPRDRIILDTGDGAAVTFMGDPEDALFAAMTMRDRQSDIARLGVNLGPVRLVKDLNGQVNIIGDGINVAQRVMSFAAPGQLLVSRSFYEVVSCLSRDYANLFHHEGARTDKHVREHDVYAVVGGKPARTSETLSGMPAEGGTMAGWLGRPAPLGFRRSALVAAPLLFTLIVAGGVGARAMLEPTVVPPAPVAKPALAPAAPKVAAAPEAAPQPEAAPKAEARPKPAPKAASSTQQQPRQVARAERKPEQKPATARGGKIELTVTPWGEILIDGRSRGISPPLRELDISPGPHTIEIRNSTFSPHLQRVDVKAGEKITIRHRFR